MKASAKTRAASKDKPEKRGDRNTATGKTALDKAIAGKPAASKATSGKTAASETRSRPASADAAAAGPESPAPSGERVKLVRDSFTMPREDFDLIADLKARALEFKRPTKKSELLRAGLQQLAALSESQLRSALVALRPLQAGRPKKKR